MASASDFVGNSISRSSTISWLNVNSTYTATVNEKIAANTIPNGAFTIDLPTNPSFGDEVFFMDPTSNWDVDHLTVDGQGITIEGDATLLANVASAQFKVIYNGVEWKIRDFNVFDRSTGNSDLLLAGNNLSDLVDIAIAKVNLNLDNVFNVAQLAKNNNLSDLSDLSAARNNLNVNNVLNVAQLAKDGSVLPIAPLNMGGYAVNNAPFSINNSGNADYTFVSSDAGKLITLDGSSDRTFTIPGSTFAVGTTLTVMELGTGNVIISAGSGQSLVNRQGHDRSAGQYALIAVTQYALGFWVLTGDTQ